MAMAQRKRRTNTESEKLTTREGTSWLIGTLLVLVALVMILSYTSFLLAGPMTIPDASLNWLGGLGLWVSERVFQDTFGTATYFAAIFIFALALKVFRIGRVRLWKWFINCAFLMVWFSTMGAWLQQFRPFDWFFLLGGTHGKAALSFLDQKTGTLGTFLILAFTALLYVLYVSGETVRTIRRTINAARRKAEKLTAAATAKVNAAVEKRRESPAEPTDTATTIDFHVEGSSQQDGLTSTDDPSSVNPDDPTVEGQDTAINDMEIEVPQGEGNDEGGQSTPQAGDTQAGAEVKLGTDEAKAELADDGALQPYDPKLDLENYHYPTLDLLRKYETSGTAVDMNEQQQNKNQILSLFKNYGIEINSIKATVGPTVTLYEITPAPGVRISKIRNLEDEIALGLRALGIRIIAPIPGKGTIGIEVPNAKPQIVSMESVLNSRKFQETDFELPMVLGKTITNEIFMVDLAKMPHLLVAGATGQGKSVGLNAILASLLYKKHPAELKLVMVDPKKVEFGPYYPIVNHFLAQVEGTEDTEEPIITDVRKVVDTLRSLCQEMDTRYDLLKQARARNIKEYNAKFKERQLNPEHGHHFLPYIVVIIDEFGDLIMTAGKEIELPIARIAQLARAVGMHMVIATQRPSANIITGAIRANFPARMAFKVSQMIESRIIIDRPGANRLVGKGDMLFLASGEPVRVQCAFIDTPEVERLCNYIASQQSYNGPFLLPQPESDEPEPGKGNSDVGPLDPLLAEAARLVVSTQQGSTSMIQRNLNIGYNRAGRVMDQLEKLGIVGPQHGSKPREVLCASEMDLDMRLNS